MAQLLVSLCNRYAGEPALLRVDTVSGDIAAVELAEPGLGTVGLVHGGDRIYAVVRAEARTDTQPERSDLVVLCPDTLEELDRWRVPNAADLHSLALAGGSLVAVSTGTDELLLLPTEGPGLGEVLWRPAGAQARVDGHHLNGLALVNGVLLVCGFGAKPEGHDWKQVQDGFVTTTGDRELVSGIHHPHTILAASGTVMFCESPRRVVRSLDGRMSAELPGYTRGLCLADDKLYAGTSMGRRRSKSNGTLNNLAAPGGLAVDGDCAIVRLNRETLAVEQVISLAAYGRELYDLLPL